MISNEEYRADKIIIGNNTNNLLGVILNSLLNFLDINGFISLLQISP